MKVSKIILYFRLAILFEIIWGARAWFTWWIDDSRLFQYVAYIAVALIAYRYKTKMRIRFSSSASVILAVVCYFLGVMFYNRFSLPSIASVVLILYPILVIINDKENSIGHLNFVAKGLACILIPGIILFLISMFVFIPAPIIQKGTFGSYVFFNQIFQLVKVYNYGFADRFQSVFLEPGYLSAMLTYLLFAAKYNLSKWYNKVLLIALILSFSLAGYLISFLGYVIFLLIEGRSLKKIVLFSFLTIILYSISLTYNNGENYVNKMILERLEYDEEKGIAGNNRTGEGTDFYYNQAVSNGSIWMGLGANKVARINAGSSSSADYDTNIRGAGYKVYFVTYGIISAIFFFLFYYFIAKINRNNRLLKLTFLLLVVVTFIQASAPQSTSWIYPYVLGIVSLGIDVKRIRK